MRKVFITFGDEKFALAKARILNEAQKTGEFDEVIAFSPEDVSRKLRESQLFKVKRGYGLWSWKPDIILSTISKLNDGDILVYADAGCSLYPSEEWREYWDDLKDNDIVASRIYQRVDKWTRREVFEIFKNNGAYWQRLYQFLATVIILKVTPFTRKFIKDWRDSMIEHPDWVMDVTDTERPLQNKAFIENRHDQTVYTALLYKYLAQKETRNLIHTQWEHIEDYDPLRHQAIRATRLRNGENEKRCLHPILKRLIKDYIMYPFTIMPFHIYYTMHNKKSILK